MREKNWNYIFNWTWLFCSHGKLVNSQKLNKTCCQRNACWWKCKFNCFRNIRVQYFSIKTHCSLQYYSTATNNPAAALDPTLAPVSLMSDKPEYGGNGKAPVRPNVCPAANNALISEEWSCQFLCPGVLLHPGCPPKRGRLCCWCNVQNPSVGT